MPGHTSAQAICTRVLIRARARTALVKRHQSTFSFFSRSQDSPSSTFSVNPTLLDKNRNSNVATPTMPTHFNALKTSPSFAHVAPLLTAIQNKDQETVWMVYSVLSRAGQLSSLLPIHHSMLLRSIRPTDPDHFTTTEASTLVERFEQAWAGMQQCRIQPDMNDYIARLELAVATKQHQMVDLTWTEIQDKSKLSGTNKGVAGPGSANGAGPEIRPTLYMYNLVLKSCMHRKNLGLAMEMINSMRRAGIKPDSASWDCILKIHVATKNWPGLESTFRNAFLTVPAGDGANQLLLQQLQQQIDQIKQEKSAWMAIPLGQRTRTLHGGVPLPSSNQNSNSNNTTNKLIPTIENIHTLFFYYAYTQDLDELRHMFDSHVRLFGIVPTTRSYNQMIQYALLSDRRDEGLMLFQELVHIGQNMENLQKEGKKKKLVEFKFDDTDPFTTSNPIRGDRKATTTLAESISKVPSLSPPPSSEESLTESGSSPLTASQSASAASSAPSQIQMEVYGPDFDTFSTMISYELGHGRNKWGRAWRLMQIMQDVYGLDPSDNMFRKTVKSMERRRGAPKSLIQEVSSNWDLIRARRHGQPFTATTIIGAEELSTLESELDEENPERVTNGRL